MFLTQTFIEGLQSSLKTMPLHLGEVRKIVGMGESYISLKDSSVDKSEYTALYELFIDDIGYKIYRRNFTATSKVAAR